jgi:hypothetical protein
VNGSADTDWQNGDAGGAGTCVTAILYPVATTGHAGCLPNFADIYDQVLNKRVCVAIA